jgi:prenyl protein peptidase
MATDGESISMSLAVATCVAMALFYVLILYVPTVILRLPSASSYTEFMIRRFICAAICTVASLVFTAFILPIKSWEASYILGVYGIRKDHLWQGVVYPLLLTSLVYAGSLVLKLFTLLESWKENGGGCSSFNYIRSFFQTIPASVLTSASNVSVWRNFIVAPVTEELVFRSCMIPLLLCAGFRINTAIFLCPVLFSLAHLNHFREMYIRHNRSYLRASLIVGLQLGYTVIFGAYASFLFIRTGNIPGIYISYTCKSLSNGWLSPALCKFYRTSCCSFVCSYILQLHGIACAIRKWKRFGECSVLRRCGWVRLTSLSFNKASHVQR